MVIATFTKTSKRIRKRVSSLKPSPENARLYSPSSIDKLAQSIRQKGLLEDLVVTADNFIISGHRRHEALRRIGRGMVHCRVLPWKRESKSKDEYIKTLREYNLQRDKTAAEQAREELVDIDPNEAYSLLLNEREESLMRPERNGVARVRIEGEQRRSEISESKTDHVRLIEQIVFNERADYWPLSVRTVHYSLLNHQFIRGYYWPRRHEEGYRHRRELLYANDDGSYQATSDLITRLRLDGTLPWSAFDDATRPLTEFKAFNDVRDFIRYEHRHLLSGYWRNYQQSQPNHVEVVCEKNTVYHLALQVTRKYQIVTTSGRGFNSIDPWHDLYERYIASGKERLIIICLTDYDPEGEMILQVGGRTLRDDFGVDDVSIIKAGVTREQAEEYELPVQNFAKESSPNHEWFVTRNDGDDTVWELEALQPQVLMDDLDELIRNIIDIDLFNAEVEREKGESVYLQSARERAIAALSVQGSLD